MNIGDGIPEVVVEVDGKVVLPAALVRVQQRLSQPTQCELHFGMGGLLNEEVQLPVGAAVRVRVGVAREVLFVGVITAVEYVYGPSGEQELIVRAYDRLFLLRQQQTVTAYLDSTLVELAQTLVLGTGLRVESLVSGVAWPMIVQHRQTHLELLAEVAAAAGVYLTVQGDTLYLLTLAGLAQRVAVTLGVSLLEARFEVNSNLAVGEVTATGWNPLEVTHATAEAMVARSGRRVQVEGDWGENGRFRLVDEAAAGQQQAQALAQAELDYRHAATTTLWGVALGNVALRPGVQLQVEGVAAAVSGQYTLTAVTHTIDSQMGFVSEVSSMPPPLPRRSRGSIGTLGVVTQVDDPRQLGRVRVRLPTYGDVETGWLQVLCPAAGPDKGLISLPAVADSVLLLLTHENPAQGIVLGGLFGLQPPPDSGVVRNRVERYTWVTPAGQQIQLDTSGDRIRLQNRAGSYIELAGGDVTIAGTAIDFRRTPGFDLDDLT